MPHVMAKLQRDHVKLCCHLDPVFRFKGCSGFRLLVQSSKRML